MAHFHNAHKFVPDRLSYLFYYQVSILKKPKQTKTSFEFSLTVWCVHLTRHFLNASYGRWWRGIKWGRIQFSVVLESCGRHMGKGLERWFRWKVPPCVRTQVQTPRIHGRNWLSGVCLESQLRVVETGRCVGLAGPASLAEFASFRFSERPCLKKIRWRVTEEVSQHWPLSPTPPTSCVCTHIQVHVHKHVHTWKHKTHLRGRDPQIPWTKPGLLVPESWDKSGGRYFSPQHQVWINALPCVFWFDAKF